MERPSLTKINSNEIRAHLDHYKRFRGCFPCNKLPSVGREGFYVVNHDTSENEGTHWVAISINRNSVYIFDSLALHFTNEYILKFLKRLNKSDYYFNIKKLQSNESNLCGEFVSMYGMTSLMLNYSLTEYINIFSGFTIKEGENIIIDIYR